MSQPSSHGDRGLIWVVQISSALSLGVLAGLLYSVKAVNPVIRFEVSFATGVAFALAAVASVCFWHVVFKLQGSEGNGDVAGNRRHKARLWLLAALLAVSLVFAFIYPLKDFSSEKVKDISFGAALALCFLTVLGLIFWRVVRFLERDEAS